MGETEEDDDESRCGSPFPRTERMIGADEARVDREMSEAAEGEVEMRWVRAVDACFWD